MTLGLEETRALEERYLMRTYKRGAVDFVRGEGALLWDAEGNEYLDFLSGLAVTSLGHSHPAVAWLNSSRRSSLTFSAARAAACSLAAAAMRLARFRKAQAAIAS